MKTILFLLLFCVAVHRCLSATCSNVIPGLVKLSRGVDITKLDLTPLDTTEDDGFDRRIFDFTCNKKATWTSPYNPGVAYDLPDQVETANSIPGGVLDASVKIHTSFNDVKRSMSSKAGVSFLKGMFSLSGSYKRFEHSIANNSRRIAEVEAFFSAIQLDFLPFWDLSLSNSALNYINKVLPVNYESDPSKFNDFIKYFGTHYFSTGKFGGLFRVSILMESSLLQTMSSRDIEANAKGSFFKILKAKGGYSGSMTSVSEQFSSKTQIAARFYGGNANLLDVDSWNNWWSSVPSNPWLFAGKLEPIINLIPDGPKKEAMKVAFNVYLDKAYLTEIQRLLYSFLNKGKVGEERALQFLNRANALISQLIPDHNAVEALGSEVEKFITVPEWFLTRTQLCYQWYPDGDGGQCSAPSRTLCANPNSQTTYYRDDTDNRGGGCRMKWAIISPTSEPWFKNVQICFRWHPDGDGGQCGGGAPREMCSPVGSYTTEYRDDTDRRGGGCQMSWRLLVPADSPGWMLNTKLCFYWYPDGDGGQCAASDRTLCAVANQWTAYYRDDTDNRSGGCQMSWGLKTD